eukprot:4896257-Pleurochrysis_carterae.AAC.3
MRASGSAAPQAFPVNSWHRSSHTAACPCGSSMGKKPRRLAASARHGARRSSRRPPCCAIDTIRAPGWAMECKKVLVPLSRVATAVGIPHQLRSATEFPLWDIAALSKNALLRTVKVIMILKEKYLYMRHFECYGKVLFRRRHCIRLARLLPTLRRCQLPYSARHKVEITIY